VISSFVQKSRTIFAPHNIPQGSFSTLVSCPSAFSNNYNKLNYGARLVAKITTFPKIAEDFEDLKHCLMLWYSR